MSQYESLRLDILSHCKTQIQTEDPSVPVFKFTCRYKNKKKKYTLILDCQRGKEPSDYVIEIIKEKKGKLVDRIPVQDISYMMVTPNKKKISFYIEEGGLFLMFAHSSGL